MRTNWYVGVRVELNQGLGLGRGPESHRIVDGLVARCRDIGHLERLGWWFVLWEELQEWGMVTDGRWWVAFIPEGVGVAGRARSVHRVSHLDTLAHTFF